MEILIKEPSEHSHAPDPDCLHVIRLKNEIKLRGASSDEGASTILFEVLRTTPLTATLGLPTNGALLQIMLKLNLQNVYYENNRDAKSILNNFVQVNNQRKTKVYANLDERLKRIALSYDVNNMEEYLSRIAMNLKIST